jgi:hypothetical protein
MLLASNGGKKVNSPESVIGWRDGGTADGSVPVTKHLNIQPKIVIITTSIVSQCTGCI